MSLGSRKQSKVDGEEDYVKKNIILITKFKQMSDAKKLQN